MTNPTAMPTHDDFHSPWAEDMATWYDQHYGEHSSNYKTIRQAQLQNDDRLLDIGCGSGAAVREAARFLDQGQATGLDLSPAMIRIAQEKSQHHPAAERLQFVVGQATELPFPNHSKTVITAINSLHHWPAPQKGLSEVIRVLTPGGRLLICDDLLSEEEKKHRNTFDAAQVEEQLRQAGFVNLETTTFNHEDGSYFITKARTKNA